MAFQDRASVFESVQRLEHYKLKDVKTGQVCDSFRGHKRHYDCIDRVILES